MAAPSASNLAGLAGTWSLGPANTVQVPGPEKGGAIQEATAESVFDPDFRSLADKVDYMDGGKYRSIVKLQMRYKGQSPTQVGWYMGTGWLIRPDLLVTAGHNVFNWASDLGPATTIHCHIGYQGKASIGTGGVQSREARRIVTSAEWIASKDNRNRDFAFIQVDRPFTGDLRLFKYEVTPPHGDEVIGVVGYPGDRISKDKYGVEEKGAMMYEDFEPVAYDLGDKTTDLKMLKYRISTFGGQSGAPVIRKQRSADDPDHYTVIGTHVYGYGDKNQASPIGAIHGNNYDNYVAAFSQEFPKAGDIDGIPLVRPVASPSTRASVPPVDGSTANPGQIGAFSQTGFQPNQQQSDPESIFNDILKGVGSTVAQVGSIALPLVSSRLGVFGGPVSVLAGAGLQALGKACAESTLDTGATVDGSVVVPAGAIERAVLAESTLQAVCRLPQDHAVTRKLLGDMKQTFTAQAPSVKNLAPKLAPGLVQQALSLAVDQDLVKRKTAVGQLGGTDAAAPGQQPSAETTLDDGVASSPFGQALLAESMKPSSRSGPESIWDDLLGTVVKTGLAIGKPLLQQGINAGVNYINQRFAESALPESALDDPNIKAAEILTNRALVADAALQAVQKLSRDELQSLKIQSADSGHEESFVSSVMNVVSAIAPTAKALGMTAVKAVAQKAVDLLMHKVDDFTGAGSGESGLSTTGVQPRLRPQRSRINLFDNAATVQVSAILPPDMTLLQVHGERAKPQQEDLNEDLPVFQPDF